MLSFLLFGRGRVLFFAVWAGGRAPPKQQKKHTPPPKQQKNKPAPALSERVLFCCLGGGRVSFFAVWAEACFFLLFGRGSCFCFCCLGGVCGLFCFFFVLLFGRGTGVHSLTGLPGSSSSDPTTKKTKQQKKNTGSKNSSGITGVRRMVT